MLIVYVHDANDQVSIVTIQDARSAGGRDIGTRPNARHVGFR
jgi:hypothetical protein